MLKYDIEIGNNNNSSTQNGDHSKKNGKVFLLQQALVVSQWMNKFDPENINEYYEHGGNTTVPLDVIAFQKYADESMR